jgi:NADP-dependent 3-hydroxy acid dehydrogenase YdfG
MGALGGKVAVVTGAAGDIGRALCRTLAAQGCRLGLVGRTAEKLHRLADDLRRAGAAVWAQAVDVGDRAAVADALTAVQGELGAVDLLIHNAGVARVTNARAPDLDDLEEMLRVNYLGGVYALAAVLPGMLARGRGQVVAVSSLAARRGLAWTAGYSASKAAFATYLESLRPALRRRGIAVTTIYPGFVRTAMSEALPFRFLVPMLRPKTAAARIVRIIRRGRREASFPWWDAWGMAVLRRLPPWAFDGFMARVGRFVLKGEY